MARLNTPWRALRPVIFAGAAAVTWLTLSSTAASADTLPDSSSLLGNATKSVSSLTHELADTLSLNPAGPPAGVVAGPGLLQPVVTPVSGLTDNLIAAVPVVNQVVPSGTVSAVSAPVVGLGDTVTAGVAQVVVAPAAEAIPVLQPVSDLMTGAAPLTVPPLEAVQADVPAVLPPAPAEDQPGALHEAPETVEAAPEAAQASESLSPTAQANGTAALETAGPGILANTALQQPAVSAIAGLLSEQPLPAAPAPVPAQAPAAPASGTGSGGSSGGPSGAAAWLNPFDFEFVPAGAVSAGEAPEHAPAPVSFDPGSSPD